MISSWKSWLSEERTALSRCLLGIVFGLAIGYFIKDWGESFHSIETFGYQVPSLISFGAVIGLDVQIISVVAIWSTLRPGSKLYVPVTWLLFGISFGILAIFNILSDRLISVGFIIPYIFDSLLPFVLIIFVGMDAMCFLWVNGLFLIPFYIISNAIVWSIELGRSIV